MTVKHQTDLLEQELRGAGIYHEINYGLLGTAFAFLDVFTADHPIKVRVDVFVKRGCERVRIKIHCGEDFRDTSYRTTNEERNARKATARIKKILGAGKVAQP